jgi:D-alanyl-lipoteichoic acid acyltransferase DltB (MBOAT superfamily)
MTIALYIAAAVVMAVGSLYFAWRSRDFRKFLAGAFFVSSGILFYLYLADVSVPLLGTSFVDTPEISGGRSIIHFILFLLCLYFGFVGAPKARCPGPRRPQPVGMSRPN